jgi:anti-sigma B factor antagonist
MVTPHHYHKNTLIVEISEGDGKLVSQSIEDFINELLSLNTGKKKEIVLDMSKKGYLNSSGLGDLIKLKDMLTDQGIDLMLLQPTSRVMSLLEMVGVTQFFKIINDKDELQ